MALDGFCSSNQGNYARALATLRESLDLGRHLGDTERTAATLEAVAAVLGRQGKAREAAHVYGAVAALRPKSGEHRPPEERLRCERHHSATRSQLADADWSEAWDEGREMSMNHAVAYALAEAADSWVAEKQL